MKQVMEKPDNAAEARQAAEPTRRVEPIGVPWGRVVRQVLAFLLAVAGILLFLEFGLKLIR